MRIIIFGPPGAGKGTISHSLIKRYGIPQISTGDLLRLSIKKMDDIGRKAKPFLDDGMLAPDDLVIPLLKKRIAKPDCAKGYILDGFPRTMRQADELEEFSHIDRVINLQSSEAVIITRLTGRRTCSQCNAIFHIKNMPPKKEGICDKCGAKLFQRGDDNPETIKKRLVAYREQTQPLISYYREKNLLTVVDGEQEITKIVQDCIDALERNHPLPQ